MGTQSNESSFAGKAQITNDPANGGDLLFQETTSETKTLPLDPTSAHDVYISTAGQTDFSIRASRDTPDAVSKGVAVFGAAALFGARDGNLFLGGFAAGVSAIEVTCLKTAASPADSAGEIATIGGRVQVRAQKVDAVTSGEATAVVLARTEMAVD